MILTPDTSTSVEKTVDATSRTFGFTLVRNQMYLFSANVDSWIAIGATPTASAGNGSFFVPKGQIITITGLTGDVATVQDVSAGKASLCKAWTY